MLLIVVQLLLAVLQGIKIVILAMHRQQLLVIALLDDLSLA